MTDIPLLLDRFWGMNGAEVRPLGGGMNSETWMVEHQGFRYVAKRVRPTAVADLIAGCEVAVRLAAVGLRTGPPVPTADGRLVLTEESMALLEHVPGPELTGDTDEEQRWIADTLAGVHRAGSPSHGPSVATFMTDWVSPQLPGVQAHAWLAAAMEAVRVETNTLTVTWSVIHTDPAPEAFIYDANSGSTGLIDWAGATRGPVLYDVASAVMYLGGPDRATTFLDTYQAHGPLAFDELQHLDAFRRFREVVQGAYFARRITAQDLTGVAGQAENANGLADARRRLRGLGLLRPQPD